MTILRRLTLSSLFFALLLPLCAQEPKSDDKGPKIDWQKGPTTVRIGDEAELKVPAGYVFTAPEGAKQLLEYMQNIPSGAELGIFAPEDLYWFVIFEFEDVGYIKDDEKDELNADDLLASIRTATQEGNEERKRRGWSTMTILDWTVRPHYEASTHNLEWSLKAKDDRSGSEVVNHHTRYLGRRGVMNAELVAGPEEFATVLTDFRTTMSGFSYSAGKDYRSFVSGDKVAEYGLSALVLGGAAAAAGKAGLLKTLGKFLLAFWKLLVAGIVAFGAAIKRLFTGRKQPEAGVVQDTQ